MHTSEIGKLLNVSGNIGMRKYIESMYQSVMMEN